MRKFTLRGKPLLFICTFFFQQFTLLSQTPAFPGAEGFGRYAKGARAVANPSVYIVTNLNDSGPGSFRDAVSVPGRFVVFAVGGIIHLSSDIIIAPNTTIAGQTAPGDGIVLFGKRVSFTGSSNTICRYLRVRLGATGNSGKDASGLANGSDIILDHMSFSWGMDEVFSINWDNKGTAPDNITVQNSIIAQGLHRENHSAGGLIQTPDGGKVSLIKNLYISNKTRNPKVKGINEFVNNVVYDWGNGNRLGDNLNYGWSGEAYIMGGSAGVSEVNIINNYFMSGPLTPPSESTPFSRGTGTFFLYGSGNYFDHNKNGIIDGTPVPYDTTGYPGIAPANFRTAPFSYPKAFTSLSAEQAYSWIIDSAGASYPRRDQVDSLLIDEVRSRGTKGWYVYRESDLPFTNGGVGDVFNAPVFTDSDSDGIPDTWEDANGLNRNNPQDAVQYHSIQTSYLNIEVYINSLTGTPPPVFIKPPTNVSLSATSTELPSPSSFVLIKWTDNSDNEDHFVLEQSEDGTSFIVITEPASGSTSFQNTGLTPNKIYYYRIRAVNNDGASSYSSVASIKTPPLPTAPAQASAPSPVNGFQYVELSAGKLSLKWTGSTNTETYSVYFGTSAGNLEKKTDLPYSANPSFLLQGLNDFVTYYWRIDAVNAKGVTEGQVWSFRTTRTIPQGLAGYWSFDETDGREVTDSSEYENHGLLGLDDDDQSIRVQGKIKNALDFATADPNMYVVSIPHQDQLYLDKGSFSLSFWMKANSSHLPQDNNTSAYLLCKGSITRNAATGATGKRFDIEFKNRQFRFAIDDDNDAGGGGKDELQTDGTPFFTNNWVHVVAIRDTSGKRLRVYLNNVLVKEQSVTKALSGIGEASDLVIGNIGELEFLSATNKPAPYKGMLDELKVFNYALSPAQILELFHTSPLPIEPYDPVVANGALLEGYGENLRLSWKGGYKSTSYKLYFGKDRDDLSFISDIDLTDPSYTVSNLTPKTNYYWRVDAIGPAGTTTGTIWQFRAVSPKGLVGHWKLDEVSGTVAADNSNYHHNGTITGMPEAVWTAGKFGNGLQYKNPSSTGAVNVPHAEQLMFDRNSFSISLWVKLTSGNSNYNSASPARDCYLMQKGQFVDPGGKWYGIQLRDSTLTFAIDDASAKSDIAISLKKASPYFPFHNNWTNIIAIKDTAAKQIRIFINGVQAGTKAYTTSGTIGKIAPLLIGNSAENKAFHDILDDVRMYNYVLSPSEISSLLTNTPLVAKATDPKPENGDPSVGYGNIELGWKGTGQAYDVYFGPSPDNMALVASNMTSNHFTMENIIDLKPYYWRVDAVRDGEQASGDIWSFSVKDKVAPVVAAKNVTVYLDENGQAQLQPSEVDNGSKDDYGISGFSLDRSSFDCTSAGSQQVVFTVTDNNGNSASLPVTVLVKDTVSPKVKAKDLTVALSSGTVQINAASMDDGSSDACGIAGFSLDRSSFSCNDIGRNEVNLTVTDVHGNTGSIKAYVTVEGRVPAPAITVSRTDGTFTGGNAETIYLGYGAQQLILNAADSAGTTFNWDPSSHLSGSNIADPVFTPVAAGIYQYTATATNEYGCNASVSVKLKVIDAVCGSNDDKVVLCHQGSEICVARSSVPAHLAHGCSIGSCDESIMTKAGKVPSGKTLSEAGNLVIYPNPASMMTTIQWSAKEPGNYSVQLCTSDGRMVKVLTQGRAFKQQSFVLPVQTNNLKSGIYFIRITTADGIMVQKLIVQK